MIPGPGLPRTRMGLWSLFVHQLDAFELGLKIVREDVLLPDQVHVDVFVRDANGCPVLVFLSPPENETELANVLMCARTSYSAHRDLLRRVLPAYGVRYDAAPRLWVVGLELSLPLLDRLRSMRIPELEVFEFRTLQVGGEAKIGVLPMLTMTTAPECSFEPPSGIQEPRSRELSSKFCTWLKRLEPGFEIEGDRYARRFRVGSDLVAELCLRDQLVMVRVPSHAQGDIILTDTESIGRASELVLRRYLACHEPAARIPTAAATNGWHGHEMPPQNGGRGEFLRRAAAESSLSREELNAFHDIEQLEH